MRSYLHDLHDLQCPMMHINQYPMKIGAHIAPKPTTGRFVITMVNINIKSLAYKVDELADLSLPWEFKQVCSATSASASAESASEEQPLTFFMHDVLGGTNPSARIVSGIVDNTAVNGQLPFARPNGDGVSANGAVDNNNIPFLTGLSGTTNTLTMATIKNSRSIQQRLA